MTRPAGIFRFEPNGEPGEIEMLSVTVMPLRDATEMYMTQLSITRPQDRSNVLNVSVSNHNPVMAAAFANEVVDVYNENAINSKQESAMATIQFIDERLYAVGAELSDVDSTIENFKSTNAAVDIMSETKLSLETSQQYKTQMLTTEIQLDMIKGIGDMLNSSGDTGLLPVNIGIEDVALSDAINRYNELVLERMRLGDATSDSNPVIRELNEQIVSMKNSLRRSVDNVYNSLQIQRDALERQIAQISSKVSTIPYLERETVSIERNQEIKAALYTYLLNKREETALSMVATTPVAQIIDRALVNPEPVATRKSLIVLAFFAIGLILPAIVIYLI